MKMCALFLVPILALPLGLTSCASTEEHAAKLPKISPSEYRTRYEIDQVHDSLMGTYTDRTQVAPDEAIRLQMDALSIVP